jgi:hypothetical protein
MAHVIAIDQIKFAKLAASDKEMRMGDAPD